MILWYHIERDQIFLSSELEPYFFALEYGIYWDKVEILGEFD